MIKYSLLKESKQVLNDFKLTVYDTPGEGNCAIQGIMHHLNVERNMNIDIFDLENVALFWRYLCTKVMEIFLDESIIHPNGEKDIYFSALKTSIDILYNGLYSLKSHEKYKKNGRLWKKFWLDHEILLPLIAFVLKKSIVISVVKHKAKKYKMKAEYMSFMHYDTDNPNSLCTFHKFNNAGIGKSRKSVFNIHHFPHTMFFCFEYNQHYDICVPLDKGCFKPRYKSGRVTRGQTKENIVYTQFLDSGYFISEDEFKSVVKRFNTLSVTM